MANNQWLMAPCGGLRLDPNSFEILYDEGKPCLASTGGGGVAGNYLKEAVIQADGSLELTNKDNSKVVFADGGFIKDITAIEDKITVTRADGIVYEYDKLPTQAIKNAFVSTDGSMLTLVRSDDSFIRFIGGEPEEYLKKVTFDASTGKMTFTKKNDIIQEYNVYPEKYIKTASVNEDGNLELTRQDGVKTTYIAGLPEHYVSSIEYEPVTNLFTYKNEIGEYNITIEPPKYIKAVVKTATDVTFTDQDDTDTVLEIVSIDDFTEWLNDH